MLLALEHHLETGLDFDTGLDFEIWDSATVQLSVSESYLSSIYS